MSSACGFDTNYRGSGKYTYVPATVEGALPQDWLRGAND